MQKKIQFQFIYTNHLLNLFNTFVVYKKRVIHIALYQLVLAYFNKTI